MNNQIKIVKSFMDPEDAVLITEYAKSEDASFTEFGNGEKEFTFHAMIKNPNVENLLNFYGELTLKFVRNNYPGPFEDYDNSKTHIARFDKGFGMHEHFDSTKPNDIATLVYLNNDYSGGEIYFPGYDISIKPDAGDLVCFPDTPDFIHGVKPITEGIRYTAPRWFTRIV
jgi:predicted 2-oxoglutarate/Fe(II)-dependent dioxygenase YbiX